MKNAIADPNVEQEGENQSGRIGLDTWYGMSASTMQPLNCYQELWHPFHVRQDG